MSRMVVNVRSFQNIRIGKVKNTGSNFATQCCTLQMSSCHSENEVSTLWVTVQTAPQYHSNSSTCALQSNALIWSLKLLFLPNLCYRNWEFSQNLATASELHICQDTMKKFGCFSTELSVCPSSLSVCHANGIENAPGIQPQLHALPNALECCFHNE